MRTPGVFGLVCTVFGSLAAVGFAHAAPLCPAQQGDVRRVVRLVNVSPLNHSGEITIADIWFKRPKLEPKDTLCVSIDGKFGIPHFVKVFHTGTNNPIVKSNGDIDFKAANFNLPVAMSFNISDALHDYPYRLKFDPRWDWDVCVVKQNANPNQSCTLGDFDDFTDQKVNRTLDILSFTDPNKPNESYEYGLYLYTPAGVIILDPKIVNQ